MKEKRNVVISIIIKSLIIVFAIIGCILSYFQGYAGGKASFLYFTMQSNIWIACLDLVLIIFMLINLKKQIYRLNDKFYLAQEIFTVSITLTGFTFCFILAPGFFIAPPELTGNGYNPFALYSIFLHMIVPILSIIDFLVFVRDVKFKKFDFLYALTLPVYYVFFSLIGYFNNWDFGDGKNFPYFFLNYDSPAGFAEFSNEAPYFMGSLYWLIIMVILVSFVSWLFIFIVNKISKKNKKI